MSQQHPAALWRAALGNLSTWKRGSRRAVHKPLLSLMLLARAEAGDDNRVKFEEIYNKLTALLDEFGPHRKSHHPEYPFWHLQADGFWEVQDAAAFPLKKVGHSPTGRTRLERDAAGIVPDKLWKTVVEDPRLRHELATPVLDRIWPVPGQGPVKRAGSAQRTNLMGIPNNGRILDSCTGDSFDLLERAKRGFSIACCYSLSDRAL